MRLAPVARRPKFDAAERARSRGGAFALRTSEVARRDVRLVVVSDREPALARFADVATLLRAGDVVVVNDAATLPGSLRGRTDDGGELELRLSGPVEGTRLTGVLFGAGDHRTPTERRPAPPALAIGSQIRFAAFDTTLVERAGRRVQLAANCDPDALWHAIYAAGAPIQYAHRADALPLWSVQTSYAARPWAAEMPSAGRPVTWEVILSLRRAGIAIASLTHAAGLSSTGDDELDRLLPWPERYEIPGVTAHAIASARGHGGRVIAVGTTVVRALEAAATSDGIRSGTGIATERIDATSELRVVDGVISGLHVPGESHFDLLSALAPAERLLRALELASEHGLSSHELGDSCLIVR
ncbi:MAG: S-adenosylmethionine:tRNA ribosyltransferase-isomerase [Kofleriaceae bacterium]